MAEGEEQAEKEEEEEVVDSYFWIEKIFFLKNFLVNFSGSLIAFNEDGLLIDKLIVK